MSTEPRLSPALWSGFMRSAERYATSPALEIGGQTFTYAEIQESALRMAATIQSLASTSDAPLTAVLAYRTPPAFTGILASLLAGHGYVPLNPLFPQARTLAMLESSECQTVIVDSASVSYLEDLLKETSASLRILLPDVSDVSLLQRRWPHHCFVPASDFAGASLWRSPSVDESAIAYLLFTSGSTGRPKGVMVSHRNVLSFIAYMADRYAVTPLDRFSQMFDLTFDLSVFDMFVCWERGACLCCPTRKEVISPGRFIRDRQLTVWFSVPSTGVFMKRLGLLKSEQYPSLRLSLFCGEPLPISVAEAWLLAAPNSVLENLYGPTELTIACTLYQWDSVRSPAESEIGIVPIGYPYPSMRALVVDDELREVDPGAEGELIMTGTQMSLGYWNDSEKTAAAFVVPPGQRDVYYRTGDRVRRPSENAPLVHLGRTDAQVKILGHRVELGEIEAVVRQVSGLDGVVAVAWPPTPSGFGGVEVFLEGTNQDANALREGVASQLPDYMLPKRFHFLERLPRNVNDKFDRSAMRALLANTNA